MEDREFTMLKKGSLSLQGRKYDKNLKI